MMRPLTLALAGILLLESAALARSSPAEPAPAAANRPQTAKSRKAQQPRMASKLTGTKRALVGVAIGVGILLVIGVISAKSTR